MNHHLLVFKLFFFFFSIFYLNFIEVRLIYKVVIMSAVQQSDSVVHIHTSILFQILFPHRLSHNTGYSPLCYTAGPHWPIIPYTSVCTCQSPTPSPSFPPSHLSRLVAIILLYYNCFSLGTVMPNLSISFKSSQG